MAAENERARTERAVAEGARLEEAWWREEIGGPQKLHFFQSGVTKKTKLQSSTSLAAFTPGKVSRFYLLPPHNGACRLPRGVPLRRPIFFIRPPGSALACKHIKNNKSWYFSASADKSSSPAISLWGKLLPRCKYSRQHPSGGVHAWVSGHVCRRGGRQRRPGTGRLRGGCPPHCALDRKTRTN